VDVGQFWNSFGTRLYIQWYIQGTITCRYSGTYIFLCGFSFHLRQFVDYPTFFILVFNVFIDIKTLHIQDR
jgi:hypothetical protein